MENGFYDDALDITNPFFRILELVLDKDHWSKYQLKDAGRVCDNHHHLPDVFPPAFRKWMDKG